MHRFLSDPGEPAEVLGWFRALEGAPVEFETQRGTLIYFPSIGALTHQSDGTIDLKRSPVMSVFRPRVRRGVIWTVGEIHVLATPLRDSFPELHKVNLALRKWLSKHECVFSHKQKIHQHDYYLEGSIRNYESEVFALPSGLEALHKGQYFVAEDDSDQRLQVLCQSLRLRGLECGDA